LSNAKLKLKGSQFAQPGSQIYRLPRLQPLPLPSEFLSRPISRSRRRLVRSHLVARRGRVLWKLDPTFSQVHR
jgi:hypothetical protein